MVISVLPIRNDQGNFRATSATTHQQIKEFYGEQIDSGWWNDNVQQIMLRICVITGIVHIVGGISEKVPIRHFRVLDVHQVVYRSDDCFKTSSQRKKKDDRSFIITILFRVSSLSF